MAKKDKKPMTVDEWLERENARQPVRGTPDPERCARVVDILARDIQERRERGVAETDTGDQEPEGSPR